MSLMSLWLKQPEKQGNYSLGDGEKKSRMEPERPGIWFGAGWRTLRVRHLMDVSNRHLGVSWAFRKRGQVLVIQFCNSTAQT